MELEINNLLLVLNNYPQIGKVKNPIKNEYMTIFLAERTI